MRREKGLRRGIWNVVEMGGVEPPCELDDLKPELQACWFLFNWSFSKRA